MRLTARPHQIPARLVAGMFILNSGLSKQGADEETAGGLHGMAAGTYPFLGQLEPRRFTELLSRTEMALGTALLIPVIPSLPVGLALTAFSAGLVGLYLRTPGMRVAGSLRPSQQGILLAKDVWLVGIGTSLVLEEILQHD
ncbi:hypothetical protein DPM19_09240 [Actinomadura craniellae]|uniref:DoxX family membrane protein n=1 Tax=Actinomadura craniellae TaxID=2231787 RepID=A0A365HA03_9ACTN|nr:hypothetical protein [Actinomadura craniellae]RAY15925.1 hypothetical protein DPM19_09240 [Actinomadura craniellae]